LLNLVGYTGAGRVEVINHPLFHLSNPRILIPSGHWLADFPSGIEVGKGCVAAHPVSHAFVSSSNTFKRNVELEDMLTVSLPSIRVSHISRVDYATYREV